MNAQTIRTIHRDFGYFYFGLIISFALSGIMMNHRDHWHPEKYTIENEFIQVKLPHKDALTEKYAENLAKKIGITDKLKRQMVKKGNFRMMFENTEVEIDLQTGKGEITYFKKTPVISHLMKLHKNTSNWWIYYSDIFGLSLIVIALSGTMMLTVGKNTFKKRGWKLALAGIIFPLLFLILFA